MKELLLTIVIAFPRLLARLTLHIALHIVELDVTVPASNEGLRSVGAVGVVARLAEEEATCADSGAAGHQDTDSRFGDAPVHWDTHGHGSIGIFQQGWDEAQANG